MAISHRILLGLILLGILAVFFGINGTWYTVDQGERAVLLRFGQAVATEGPGLHFKLPLVEEAALDGRGIQIVSVQVEDVSFSDAYETAVENRMKSVVLQYQAEAEKQQRITNADAAAYEVKAAADAQPHAIQVQGEAQASAIKARADALQSNPNLISLTAAEKWNGALPTTIVPGGATPFVQVSR